MMKEFLLCITSDDRTRWVESDLVLRERLQVALESVASIHVEGREPQVSVSLVRTNDEPIPS